MESKHDSVDRKRSSSSFQAQPHQPYSLSHLDSSCPKDLQDGILLSLNKKPKIQNNEFPSPFIIKDLRIKRVYSPTLRNVNVCNSKFTNGHVGVGDEYQRVNGISEGKSEELAHSTPPDAEILARDYQGVSLDECPRSSNRRVEESSNANTQIRIDSPSKTRSVLKPCFKQKLFRAPGSIAYKRLLPYLMDNDTCTLQEDPHAKHERNLEKRANVDFNLYNYPRDSSSVYSDTCAKNAVFSSNQPLNAIKLSSPQTDRVLSFVKSSVNGSTKNFENGNPGGNQKYIDPNNDSTLAAEGSSLKKNNVIRASSDEKMTIKNGGCTESQIEHLPDKEQSTTLELKKLSKGNSSISSHISSEIEESKLSVSKKWSNIVCKNNEREDDFNEESLQMTSLNSDISCKPVTEEKTDKKMDCTQGADQKLGISAVSENHSDIVLAIGKKNGSDPRSKLFRNPLSQLKLLNRQGSISYRRMLPFLTELMKDNSEYSALENIDCPRLEKGLATTNVLLPSSNFQNSTEKSESLLSHIKPCDGNSDTGTVLSTSSQTLCETEKCLMPAGVDDTLPTPSKLPKQQQDSEQEILDKCKMEMESLLHSAVLLNDQAVTSLYPTANLESLTEDESELFSKQLPINSEDCTKLTVNVSDAKLPETESSNPNSFDEEFVLPEKPINIRKGILKRNPRGCRGICSCLNCSSFRLHAERAFEFSRNQLQDAEEVALDLMKELFYLRDMLEKSANGATDDAEYHLHKVKEACRKASETELIAKERLAHMNYELDVHCRITSPQRPNVKFSGDIENRD